MTSREVTLVGRLRTRMDRLRQSVPSHARWLVVTVAVGLTLATWTPMATLLVGWELPAWEAFVHNTCDPFCHQFPSRSFQLAEHLFPLCVRCSGMWLGITLGVALAMGVVPKHRWTSGATIAITATALSALDMLREEASQVAWPWVRFLLGFLIFVGVTLAVSFDLLAVLVGMARWTARRARLAPRRLGG